MRPHSIKSFLTPFDFTHIRKDTRPSHS